MKTTEIQNRLADFSEKHNLVDKAYKACNTAMANSLADDKMSLNGMSREGILFFFDQQQFIFHHHLRETPIIRTQIGLYKKDKDDHYAREHEPVGYYMLDCNKSGEIIDDWLIIE